ncbi:hypothetical protein [Leptospira noguchii]|uniref:hypothetical protein n=1 Tax=Leptospira noguchii TaxID=28182 RepID=UPI001FB6C68E|nr:hypothetical protein [Leptospira noguchii]UOG49646.1 hypothetical protein MAL00_05135 [Leptospira noguchii]
MKLKRLASRVAQGNSASHSRSFEVTQRLASIGARGNSASRFYWRSTGYKGKDHHPEDVQVHLSNKSRKKMTRWG